MAGVRLGLDRLSERPDLLLGRRVGLLCHGASFDSQIDAFREGRKPALLY